MPIRILGVGISPFDLIVMTEVIEHLHVAPRQVLAFLRTLLVDDGILVIQTPNAVTLHKRIEMLIGRNPYEAIREEVGNPGHFREYTKRELRGAVVQAGYQVERWFAASYWTIAMFTTLMEIGGGSAVWRTSSTDSHRRHSNPGRHW